MRWLVIGGSGLVGLHTVEHLASRGEEVAVSDLPAGHTRAAAWPAASSVRFVAGDVRRASDVAAAVEAVAPDIIVNLAAFGGAGRGLVRAAEEDPREAVAVNVGGLLNVLHVAASRDLQVVWTSSTTVLGSASRYGRGTVGEDALIAPRSLYAATKALGEQLVRTFRERQSLRATALRPTLVWGVGGWYRGIQSPLADMLEAALSGRSLVVEAPDEVWDLLYVRDSAAAIAHFGCLRDGPALVHVSGYRARVADVREAVLRRFPGVDIEVRPGGRRLDLPWVDTSLAAHSGFVPRFDLEASVSDCAEVLGRWSASGPGGS